MTTELSDLLRRAAEPIAERDFVAGAFAAFVGAIAGLRLPPPQPWPLQPSR